MPRIAHSETSIGAVQIEARLYCSEKCTIPTMQVLASQTQPRYTVVPGEGGPPWAVLMFSYASANGICAYIGTMHNL